MRYDYIKNIPPGYYDEIFRRKVGVQSKWHYLKFSFAATLLSPSARRLIDVGCGPGTFSQVISNDIEYLGLDLSQPQVKYATRTYGSTTRKFLVACNHWPVANDFADAVTLLEVIEHLTVEQTKASFSEALRCLRPGGQLIVTTPNYHSMWPVLEAIVNRRAKVTYEDQHINRYTRRRLRENVCSAGFINVRVGTLLLIGPFAAAFNWMAADAIDRIERKIAYLGVGSLLYAMAIKPASVEVSSVRSQRSGGR
jgi:2-polyprenyl-3-methyl-5-hydroxy-6-metoxy-1,4-benzoquinol methylase